MKGREPDRVFQDKEVDLRGERIDLDTLRRIGENVVVRARSSGIPSPQVVLAGDTRDDTLALLEAISRGILHRGGSIILIGGDAPKPLGYFSAELLAADAIAYVTASHAPARYNGVKVYFTEKSASHRRALSLAGREVVNWREDCIREYHQYLIKTFGPNLGRRKPLVVDPLFGAARVIAPEILKGFGFDVECLHDYVDRKFTLLQDNSPDPTLPNNLDELKEVVKSWGGMGVAFDGDMDRAVFVDENSEVVHSDEIAMILGSYILKKLRKKAKVVYHCQCSNSVPEVIEEARGQAIIQETGWRSVKEKMKEVRAAFGAEISGHFFYGDGLYLVNNGDDGLFTTLMLSKVLRESRQTLAEARDGLPAYFTSPELRVTYDQDRNSHIVQSLRARFEKDHGYAVRAVGRDLRAEKHDGKEWRSWVVFRASRTEPQKLSFRFEGRSLEHLAEVKRDLLESIPASDERLSTMLDESYKTIVGDPTAYYRRALEAAGKIPR